MRTTTKIQEQMKGISFSDAQIQHVDLINGEVLVTIHEWQQKTLRFRFKGVVYFKSFEFGNNLSDIHVSDDTEEIKEAMRVIINDGGSAEGYPDLVQVSFVAEAPVMIVVFQEFTNES
jgi:hypothetical protein